MQFSNSDSTSLATIAEHLKHEDRSPITTLVRAILSSDAFTERFAIALHTVLRNCRADDDFRSEVTLIAVQSIHNHLRRTHAASLRGDQPSCEPIDQDALGARIYCLCLRHITWALKTVLRASPTEQFFRIANDNASTSADLPPFIYDAVLQQLRKATHRLPANRRTVALCYLNQLSLDETRSCTGLTVNTIKSYRQDFRRLAVRLIAEELAAFGY